MSHLKYLTDLILGKGFCIFIFFHFLDSSPSVFNGLHFYFSLRDSASRELVNNSRFLAKLSRDLSRDLLTQCLYFKMSMTVSSLYVPNSDPAPSSMPKL